MILLALLFACRGSDDKTSPDSGTSTEGTSAGPTDATLDADHVLVVSSMNLISALSADGSTLESWKIDAFVDDSACKAGQCRAEGVIADGDGLLVCWALQDRSLTGGLLRLDPKDGKATATWVSTGWDYPHEIRRSGDGSALVVADAILDKVVWVPDTGAKPADATTAIGATETADLSAYVPNGLARLDDGGKNWLLISYRGGDTKDPGNEDGRLVMMDITDPAAPVRAWVYPATGTLKAPHDPSFHWRDGRWLLVYAQSHGVGAKSGSVGVAETSDLSVAPTYLADLVPAAGSWGYPRGALLTGDDRLFVSDTPQIGGFGGSGEDGSVDVVAFPSDLTSTGKGGTYTDAGSDQAFVTVDTTEFATGFDQTYRSFVWKPTF